MMLAAVVLVVLVALLWHWEREAQRRWERAMDERAKDRFKTKR